MKSSGSEETISGSNDCFCFCFSLRVSEAGLFERIGFKSKSENYRDRERERGGGEGKKGKSELIGFLVKIR